MANKVWIGTSTPGDLNVAANWDPSGVPGASDNVFFRESSQNVTAGFTSISTITSLEIDQSFTGTFSDYWEVTCPTVTIGSVSGFAAASGSAAVLLDVKTGATTVNVNNSGSASTSGQAAIKIKGNNSGNVLNVKKGSVEIEPDATETGTFGTVNVTYTNNRDGDAKVVVGSNVTLTTWKQTGGTNILRTAATTVTTDGGHLTTEGSGAITTLNANGGTTVSNSTGTITTANITGKLDLAQSLAARTVTTTNLDDGGTLIYDPAAVTLTNQVDSTEPVQLTALKP